MALQEIFFAFLRGMSDSVKGFATAFYLHNEYNERMARVQHTPSPSPSMRINSRRERTPRERASRERTPRESTPITVEKKSSKLLQRIIRCSLLNGAIFLISLIIFDYMLIPVFRVGHEWLKIILWIDEGTFNRIWDWTELIMCFLFQYTWVVPLFLMSKLINVFYFQDIADLAYKYSGGRPIPLSTLSMAVADVVFSVVIQTKFLIQAVLLTYIPFPLLGRLLSSIHLCLLYSLYAFDYKWSNMGWELHKRLAYIEMNWPYFIGFGLPMTLATQCVTSIALSGSIFASLFQFSIISAQVATPVTTPCAIPLRIFTPVVCLSNGIFGLFFRRKIKKQPAIPNLSK